MEKYHSYEPSGIEFIGDIPDHWKISKFKYDSLTPVQYGLNISGDNYKEEGVRFIRITDLTEEGELILSEGKYLDEDVIPEEFLLRKFDVLFCRSGHTVGKSYLHLQDGKFTSGGYLVRFNFRNYTESKFIFYLSKTDFYWDWIKLNTVVSTIENVNGDKYQNFQYPKPPLSEQHQIVRFLDEKTEIIDKLISTKQRKIDLLKEQRTSLINQVITKGLDPNVKMKDSGVEWIGHIPEHWIVKKMKYFVKICNGSDYKEFVLDEGGYPVYGTGGVFSRCSKFLYDKVSVLLGRKGSVDRPQIVYEPFWTSDTTYYTEIKEDVSPLYFFHLVNQIQFDRYIYGSAIPSMTKSVYDDMLFPYPPSTEQYQIVEYLNNRTNEIDDLVSMEQKKINLLKEYRQSLISEVITGKIDVRTKLN